MLSKSSIERKAQTAVDTYLSSECVSRDELASVIAKTLYDVLQSRDFINYIDQEIAKRIKL